MPELRMLLMSGLMLADKTAGLEDQVRAAENVRPLVLPADLPGVCPEEITLGLDQIDKFVGNIDVALLEIAAGDCSATAGICGADCWLS